MIMTSDRTILHCSSKDSKEKHAPDTYVGQENQEQWS